MVMFALFNLFWGH